MNREEYGEPSLNLTRCLHDLIALLVFKGHINHDEARKLLADAIVPPKP